MSEVVSFFVGVIVGAFSVLLIAITAAGEDDEH